MDSNGPVAEGAGWHDMTIAGGTRQSAARAYLHPVRDRANLTIATESKARRLLFNGTRCLGVEFQRRNQMNTAFADVEVVLSAGAVDSPRLLLLSGVGAAAELEAADVAVVHDLPGVGRNLHKHPLCGVEYDARQRIPTGRTNYGETSLLWRSHASLAGPDMQILFLHIPLRALQSSAPLHGFTFGVATVPDARGSLRLVDADPNTPPLIDPNYLGEESDVRRMLHGMNVAREIAATAPFTPWRAREAPPGAAVTTERALRTFLSRATRTYFHPVGSCMMGDGPEAVVDPELRVRGLNGLRGRMRPSCRGSCR
jgi:choline dehydrogenase